MIQKQNILIKNTILWVILIGFFLIFTPFNIASAQNPNVCEILNPAEGAEVLAWLEPRPGGRQHLGVDIMLPLCTPVSNQLGCHIVMNGNSPLWGRQAPTGYGYYTRYRCNDNVEVRFTHLNGYDADRQMVINGRTGAAQTTPPHIHYEVYADAGSGPRAMDPECVWGTSDTSKCCQGVSGPCLLGNGPADMCNPTVLQQLSQNHDARATGGSANSPPNGYTSMSLTQGIDPFQVPPGQYNPTDADTCDGSTPPATPATPSGGGPVPTPDITVEDSGNTPVPVTYPGAIMTFPPDPNGTEPNGTPGSEAAIPPTTSAASAPKPSSGCANDTWIAMVNQGVLEARRENIVNQRLIAKADSVLTYTCFDQYVANVGAQAGPLFSATDFWAGRTIDILGKTVTVNVSLGSTSLDGSLSTVVSLAAASYLSGNFSHGLLGETAAVSAPSGGCNVMRNVWQAAKCNNLNTPFYRFDDLISFDPREYPASMACGP